MFSERASSVRLSLKKKIADREPISSRIGEQRGSGRPPWGSAGIEARLRSGDPALFVAIGEKTVGARHEKVEQPVKACEVLADHGGLLRRSLCTDQAQRGRLHQHRQPTTLGAKTLLDVESASQTTYIQFDLSSIPAGYTGSSQGHAEALRQCRERRAASTWITSTVPGRKNDHRRSAPALGSTIAASVPLTLRIRTSTSSSTSHRRCRLAERNGKRRHCAGWQ